MLAITYNTTQKSQAYVTLLDSITDEAQSNLATRAILKADLEDFNVYGEMIRTNEAQAFLDDFEAYIARMQEDPDLDSTFVAAFPSLSISCQEAFEIMLWNHLQRVSDLDPVKRQASISDNQVCSKFQFTILGRSVTVMGLNPHGADSSQKAPFPVIAIELNYAEECVDNLIFQKVGQSERYNQMMIA